RAQRRGAGAGRPQPVDHRDGRAPAGHADFSQAGDARHRHRARAHRRGDPAALLRAPGAADLGERVMDEAAYNALVGGVFKRLLKGLDALDPDVLEADSTGDMITITAKSGEKVIVNTQRA